jgi:predicted DnaQ family exonuclease/DinG family helicase
MRDGRGSAKYPSTVVGVDVETTGVDARADAIIEVAAVRLVDGELDDTFSSLVDPGREIPPDVVYLTGISDDDVAGAPAIDDVLPGLVEFIGDSPIVAHQASFDLGFLNAAAANRPELLVGGGGTFDTLMLSRALVPRLPSHRLAALVRFFDIPHERAHRAADDALAAALLYDRLLDVMDQVGSAILARMAGLADSETGKLISIARERAEGRLDPFALPDHGLREGELLRYDNSRRIDTPRTPREERIDVDLDALEALFEERGAIAARLPGYETRREQLQMMRAVGDALCGGVHLVVEAGTGVGKSLAYLVPAAHFAVANGERVVISTNTRNLQEQLFQKDVPFLERALDVPFSAALLKGRGNYLCLQRWRQILEKGLSPSERAELLPLVMWEEETRSGDVSENGGFRQRGYLWSRLSAEGGPCLGQKCPSKDKCYLLEARRASQAAHVVVVNHSLLFSDTEAGNRILGDYGYLICDEAHNIERVATEHLGRRANVWRARATLDALHRVDGVGSGDLSDLMASIDTSDGTGPASAVKMAAERLQSDVETARTAAEAFFGALSARHESLNLGRPVEFGKLRYRPEEPVLSIVSEELRGLTQALDAVSEGASSLADLVADSDLPRAESAYQNLTFHAERSADLARDLEYLASAGDAESVFWLELRTFRESPECELRSAPVSIAEKMGEFLYSRIESMTMTSATLTVDGSFDFITERLGLDTLPDWRVLTLDVGSPYDYDSQAIVVVAGHLPQPSSAGFNGVVAKLVVRLAGAAAGGTLVLFTSRSSLDAVFKAVRDPLTAHGKLVLGQGHGGSATALLDQFARETDAVLLATSSFWEGVDVPGRSLEQLIIAKLPFPVPSDPVIQAHCERYEDAGENSFERYMIPRTAIRVRQGFGRLIRSTTDVGAVVFLDSRLSSRRYGQRLLDELPTRALIARSDGELMSTLAGIHAGRA